MYMQKGKLLRIATIFLESIFVVLRITNKITTNKNKCV